MAVVSANPHWSNKLEVAFEGDRSHSVRWVVVTDTVMTPVQILASGYLPSLASIHPEDPYAYCSRLSSNARENSRLVWDWDVEYTNKLPQANEPPPNPLDRPVQRSFKTNKISRAIFFDVSGDPIINSAKQPFEPAIERPFANPVYIFKKNLAYFSDEDADAYIDHLNATPWLSKAAKYVRCNDITADEAFENGYSFWQCTFEFEFNRFGWQEKLLNNGFIQIVSSKFYRCKDERGQDVTEPALLSSAGAQLTPAQIPGSISFETFDIYPTADFNALGLVP